MGPERFAPNVTSSSIGFIRTEAINRSRLILPGSLRKDRKSRTELARQEGSAMIIQIGAVRVVLIKGYYQGYDDHSPTFEGEALCNLRSIHPNAIADYWYRIKWYVMHRTSWYFLQAQARDCARWSLPSNACSAFQGWWENKGKEGVRNLFTPSIFAERLI